MRNRASKEVLANIQRLKKFFRLYIAKPKKQRYICSFANDNRREFNFGERERLDGYDERIYNGSGEEED